MNRLHTTYVHYTKSLLVVSSKTGIGSIFSWDIKKTTRNRTDRALLGLLEVVDDLGDVGVHLVKVGVLGGCLPVLAASHGVHNVLSEKE